MIFKYLTYLIFVQGIYGILGNLFLFPIAYLFRDKIRKNKSPKILYWLLHDYSPDDVWGDYGNAYVNPELKKTFWVAWKWVWRNPIHNYMMEHGSFEPHHSFVGWETCQRDNASFMWRTPKTKDANGVFKDKEGEYMDFSTGVYGKQRIKFMVGKNKVFRYSGAVPRKIGNVYWIFAYKFGWESVNWAIQFQMFTFRKLLKGDSFKLNRYEYKLN